MMVGRRLFIGNLHSDTQRKDLESILLTLGDSQIHSIEIRQKNDATFAFVDVDCGNETHLAKYMDDLNKTTMKGQLLKVQMAKENFMERLKREREGSTQDSYSPQSSHSYRDTWRNGRSQENFDFEIVPTFKIQNQNQNDSSKFKTKIIKNKLTTTIQKNDVESENSSSDENDDEKDGIPMFRGLGFYPGLLKPNIEIQSEPKISKPVIKIQQHDQISQRMLAIAGNKPIPRPPLSIPSSNRIISQHMSSKISPESLKESKSSMMVIAGGLKLNPYKKEKSDLLRIQSLTSRYELQKTRSNLINNSLSNNTLQRFENSTTLESKKSKSTKSVDVDVDDFLFGNDNNDEEEEDYTIKIKPQYEGKVGQKMLELNANFAWDKRFQIDGRFAEPEDILSKTNEEIEKNSQFEILGNILGKTIQKITPKFSKHNNNIEENIGMMTRYDPTMEEHRELFEVEISKDDKSKIITKKNDVKSDVVLSDIPEQKSTFKIATNLKNLFNDKSFSVLNTFGGGGNEMSRLLSNDNPVDDIIMRNMNDNNDKDNQPRSFWNKNPFKYDSSSDEGDDDDKTPAEDKIPNNNKSKSTNEKQQRNYFKEDLFKRDKFFFNKNDERLKNIFNEFLKDEEDLDEVKKKFNDIGRSELKIIAKSKWKNSKRKNEKRIKIIRLIRRKKRREAKQKQESKK